MAINIEQFVERLTQSGLMSAEEIDAFQAQLPPGKRPKDLQQFAQSLVKQGKLTKFQAQAVYQGKTKGLVFGQYTVLDQLGEGGMGLVLKAQHRRMKRLVAIKILSSAGMKQPGAVERFHREVEAAAKLSHPNIVAAHDADEHQGMHYLAMEYIEGQDLGSLVADHGPLEVRQAVECALQAAHGLQYAHEQGIVHRDIKPGNLLLDKKGTVKILDMGLALFAGADAAMGGPERLTSTGQVMGTCDYLSPEQALDTHAADHRTDIYALGCTLYRLLTGHPPYRGESLMQILLAHRENPIPSLLEARPEVPAALDACFQKMVAKEPQDRQQSMADVAAELEAVLAILSGRPVGSSGQARADTLDSLRGGKPVATLTRQKKRTAAEETLQNMGGHDTGANLLAKVREQVARVRHKPLLLAGLAGGLVVFLATLLTLAFRHGTLVVEIDENLGKDVQVTVSQGGQQVQIADATSGWTLSLDAGKYDLAVAGGDDKFHLDAQSVTVTHGGQVKVKVALKPLAPAVAPFDAKQAVTYQERWAKHLGLPVELTNSIGMKLKLIPPGEFEMGSPKEFIEEALKPEIADWYKKRLLGEGPKHHVRINKPFYLGVYDVTQQEYQRVTGTNPSGFSATGKDKDKVAGQDTKRFPVETVGWDDAAEFCRKLSEMPEERSAGRAYRLPSETQWEYACRAGNAGQFGFSPDDKAVPKEGDEDGLSDYAWFNGNSADRPHSVGLKRPSAWGLYDMHGNVWEWCQDWYDKDYYANSPADDPAGPPRGSIQVIRGGAWGNPARHCRSAIRNYNDPGYVRYNSLGFRVSLVLPDAVAKPTEPGRANTAAARFALPPAPAADSKSQTSNLQSETPSPAAAPLDHGAPWRDLFDGKTLNGWKQQTRGKFAEAGIGECTVEDGCIALTGLNSAQKVSDLVGVAPTGPLPAMDYEISFEAMKLSSTRDFASLKFPIRDKSCVLLVGGRESGEAFGLVYGDLRRPGLVHLLMQKVRFEPKRWYRVKLRVTEQACQAWLDDSPLQFGAGEGDVASVPEWRDSPDAPFIFHAGSGKSLIRAIRFRQLHSATGKTASAPSPDSKILVSRAEYGIPGDRRRTRDVTAKVQSIVDAGRTSFPVVEMIRGDDPAYGRVKTLTVEYVLDGKPHRASGRDTDTIDLRLGMTSGDPVPGSPSQPAGRFAKTSMVGGDGGGPFEDMSTVQRPLLGFNMTTVNFVKSTHCYVKSVQPIYLNAASAAKTYGQPSATAVQIIAKQGYAVGGIVAKGGLRVDGFTVVFMRIGGESLDPTDSYESNWAGDKGGGAEVRLGGDGRPVVGICGRCGADLEKLGLIQ